MTSPATAGRKQQCPENVVERQHRRHVRVRNDKLAVVVVGGLEAANLGEGCKDEQSQGIARAPQSAHVSWTPQSVGGAALGAEGPEAVERPITTAILSALT